VVTNEEALRDALVHNNKSHLWTYLGFVVKFSKSLSELGDLARDHLATLRITNAVPVDDIVRWQFSLVSLRKCLNGTLERVLHLLLDDLLTFLLH